MEKFFLSSSTTASQAALPRPFLSPPFITWPGTKTLSFSLIKPRRFSVLASKDENDFKCKLTEEDLMELKFGQMLGEDPKLTLAKIMGRKVNPDASYLEIEKNFYKNKGKIVEVKEVPFDVLEKRGSAKSKNKLNFVKPVPKEGIQIGGSNDLSLVDIKKPRKASSDTVSSSTKSIVPNVILRKPSFYNEDDDEMEASFRLKVKPNLSLKMRTEKVKDKFGSMTLLKRPEPVDAIKYVEGNQMHSGKDDKKATYDVEENCSLEEHIGVNTSMHVEENCSLEEHIGVNTSMHATESVELEAAGSNKVEQLLENQDEPIIKLKMSDKPKPLVNKHIVESASESPSSEITFVVKKHLKVEDKISAEDGHEGDTERGVQPLKPNDFGPVNGNKTSNLLAKELVGSSLSVEAAIQGKAQRLDQPVKATTNVGNTEASVNPEAFMDYVELMNSSRTSHLKEHEDTDWDQAVKLCKAGLRVDVDLISCSTRGFVVSFGSLIGFLPYRNLTAKWKFFAFPSWLRRKGLDPSKYRQSLGIAGSFQFPDNGNPLASSPNFDTNQITKTQITADVELEDLLRIYDHEKTKFLSTFIGQRVKVNVVSADKKSRKLIFSVRPKEKEEIVEKKRCLMARLSVGDVIKCCIKKITYFGIFVEVEGVPALIHQTEVSWDATLDPASYFKIGQIVEAKVHELDFSLERIFLSLKEITPDPMIEALECVVGDRNALTGRYESTQTDSEWADVDSLIKELERIDGVRAVSKGRFFLSPGLAPTFQVYMASVFDNQYKLLARSGNKAQEVMVEASLGTEEMRTAIMTCTNRVA